MTLAKTARIIKEAAKPGFTYLRKEEREKYEREILSERAKIKEAQVHKTEIDPNLVNRRIRDINEILETQSPPEVKGDVRDELIEFSEKIVKEVRDDMLPQEVMRRNPPGAVQKNIDFHAEHKKKILLWKNLRKITHRDSEDPDLCNFEIYRPRMTMGGPSETSTFMPEAQIGGHMALSESSKSNFPESMGKNVNSALEQVIASVDAPDDPELDSMLEDFDKAREGGLNPPPVQEPKTEAGE